MLPFSFTAWFKRQGAPTFFLACGLLLVCGLLIHPLGDPEVFLHLRDGRFWLESGLHVDREPFAYTVPGMSFEKSGWLFNIGLYLLYRVGGLNLLILINALIMLLAVWCLGQLLWRRWNHASVAAALLGLVVLAPLTRTFPESQYVVTYLFLALALLWLDDYRRQDGLSPRTDWILWKFPVLTLLWANLHSGFLLLFVCLGASLAEDAWCAWRQHDQAAAHRVKALLAVSIAAFLAGAANPQGFGLYSQAMHSLGLFGYPLTEGSIPTFGKEPFFFVLLILAWAVQCLNWSRARWCDLIPLLIFSYLGLKSQNGIPLFLIAALPSLAGNLADLRQQFRPGQAAPLANRSQGGWWLGGGVLLMVLIAAAGSGYAFRLGEIPRFYPTGALTWLEAHPLQGRLLTHDIWGGYTGWVTHGRVKIFSDSRLSTFGEKLCADYYKMIWGDPGECLSLLDHYGIQGVLVSPKNDLRLFQALWNSHQWTLVYWDDVSLLYVRNSGLNQNLLLNHGFYAVDPRHQPYFNPALPDQALLEIRRAQTQAPDSFLPFFFEGDLELRKGDFKASRLALQRSQALAPGHPPTLLNLGILDRKENHLPQAEIRFRQVLGMNTDSPVLGMAAFQLGLLLSQEADAARRREAGQWAEKAVRWLPGWKPALELKQHLETGK
jgi:hypothetical protein